MFNVFRIISSGTCFPRHSATACVRLATEQAVRVCASVDRNRAMNVSSKSEDWKIVLCQIKMDLLEKSYRTFAS